MLLGLALSPCAGAAGALPALDLDFTGGAIDPRITFSRPSTATRVNSAGLLETVASGAPRIDYDPVTLACRGLLVEEQRTNLALWSGAVSAANGWSTSGGSGTLTPGFSDPAGGSSAGLFTADGTVAPHFCVSSIGALTYTSGVTYALSRFMRAGSTSLAQLSGPAAAFGGGQYANFSLTGSGAVLGYSGLVSAPKIEAWRDGWYRCTIVVTATATATTNGTVSFAIASGSDGRAPSRASTDSFYVWGDQPEAGGFSTSLILTGAAQATRSSDVATMSLGSWFNPAEGTLLVEAEAPAGVSVGAYPSFAAMRAGLSGSQDTIEFFADQANVLHPLVRVASVDQAGWGVAYTPGAMLKMALAFKVGDFAYALNGSTPATDASGTLPTVDTLRIGSNSGGAIGALNSRIRRVRYYRGRLANAQLQGLTA
jgi:hypothetical protein